MLWPHSYPSHIVSSGVFMHVMRERLLKVGVEVDLLHLSNLKKPSGILQSIRTLQSLSERYDVVHAQFGSVCGWVSSFARTPRILTLRGTDLFGIEKGDLRLRLHGVLSKAFSYRSLKAYSKVVTVSNQMREMVSAYRPSDDVIVQPDGLNLEVFCQIPQQVARARLGLPCDKKWVLVAATFASNPIKRWPLAKRTFEIVEQRLDNVELHTVAGVPHEQMPLWMNAADVVVVTSTHEGWPNIVKEALACNTPFVSTDVSDLKHIAKQTSNCFVAGDNPEGLAAGVIQALQAGKHENLRRLVEPMAIESVADRYLSIYRELVPQATTTQECRTATVKTAA